MYNIQVETPMKTIRFLKLLKQPIEWALLIEKLSRVKGLIIAFWMEFFLLHGRRLTWFLFLKLIIVMRWVTQDRVAFYHLALILIDLSKAFDTINYKILLSILHYSRLSENSIALFSSSWWRMQRVKYFRKVSTALYAGVLQASNLEQLLYIYTYYLYNCIKFREFYFYSDNLQIYYSFKTEHIGKAERRINNDLNELLQESFWLRLGDSDL